MKVILETKQHKLECYDVEHKACENLIQALNISKSKDATFTVNDGLIEHTMKSNDIISVNFIYE